MKKTLIITALSFTISGLIIFGGAMTMIGWDFNKISTVEYETNTYKIDNDYKNISIVTKTAHINFEKSESDTTVVCYEQSKVKHNVTVKDDTLSIELVDARKWYEYISLSFKAPKITVYLPTDKYVTLSIEAYTGDIEIPKDFTFDNIDIKTSTGDVNCQASAKNDLNVKLSTGNIKLKNLTAGDVNLTMSTGGIHLTDVKCNSLISDGNTGDMELTNVIAIKDFNIKRSTGDIKLDRCDAKELYITTDTGDVNGTLLTDKVFICKTDTGDVDVPKTTTGGRCEITTNTGNIKIKTEK